MKAGYTKNIHLGMIFKKHFCHKCGARLCKSPVVRLVSPGDEDWKKYNRIGQMRIAPVGDIQVTEYNFKCPDCGSIMEYDEQLVIHKIQKKLKSNVLSAAELEQNKEWATKAIKKRKKIQSVISKIVMLALIAIVIYYIINGGELDLRLY